MKRTINSVLCVFLAAAMAMSMAACSSPGTPSPSPTSSAPAEASAPPASPADPTPENSAKREITEPITIQWWHSQDPESYGELLDNLVNTFNQSQDKITVEQVYVGNASETNESLVAANAANSGLPAICTANTSYVTTYGNSGLCEDLTPYIEDDVFAISDFGSGLVEATAYEGRQVTLPYLISTQIMYYNADMAKEKQIEIPTKLDDFEEFLKKTTVFNADGTTQTYGCVMGGWDYWYFETLYMNNGVQVITDENKSDLNQPAAVAITSKIKEWVDKGYVYWSAGADAASKLRTMVVDGKAFSAIHTSSTYNTYVDQCSFNVGMAWLPGGATINQEIGGVVLMIPAKNDQAVKNAAWEFMKYLTSADVQMQWAYASGYIPTRNSVIGSEAGMKYLGERPAFLDVFANMNCIMPRSAINGWAEAGKIWVASMEEMFLKNLDPQKQMDAMVQEIDEVLADLD